MAANLYLPPMLHWMVTAPQYDGRYVGRYVQEWTYAQPDGYTPSAADRMGYYAGSDAIAQQWRDVYWTFGQNLIDMMDKAEAQQRWDLLGVGYSLKAWGWQTLVDFHGPIIIKEAFDQTRLTFDYDTEEYAYQEVARLIDKAIENLQRTDGAVDKAYLARGDKIYDGDRAKWLKFAYGLKARMLSHFTNKASLYDPAAVIAAVDNSFTSNADDALLPFPATWNDDTNFWGASRGNINDYRQTEFAVHLMDGTDFGAVDPRMSRMMAPSPDSAYRGLDPMHGWGALSAAQRPNNFYGYPGSAGAGKPGRYIYVDKARMPTMTYSELQFIKAEAAYRMGNKPLALEAFRNGVSSHIDFVNARNNDDGQQVAPISDQEKADFLAAIVPTDPNALTLTDIMSQKYIALFGWGHNEIWLDMRRYHYTDLDPATGEQVYPGFTPPSNLYADNGGKLVYRARPRYNSEYVWNREGLAAIGGLDDDYHTKPLWIIEP